jgi:hypothetical protein
MNACMINLDVQELLQYVFIIIFAKEMFDIDLDRDNLFPKFRTIQCLKKESK